MAANNPAQGKPTAHSLTARLQRAVRGPRPRRRSSRREVSRAHAHPTHKDAAPPQQPLSRLRSGPFSKASKCHRTYRRAGGFNSLGRSRRPGCAICVLCATTSALCDHVRSACRRLPRSAARRPPPSFSTREMDAAVQNRAHTPLCRRRASRSRGPLRSWAVVWGVEECAGQLGGAAGGGAGGRCMRSRKIKARYALLARRKRAQ